MTTTDPGSADLDRIAIIGHGEVGQAYSRALAERGHDVGAHDPHVSGDVPGVRTCASVAEAVDGADAIFVLTAAAASHDVARAVSPVLDGQRVYADFTSSAPSAKQQLSGLLGPDAPVAVVDVAILGPVVKHGASTPLMAAGPGAAAIGAIMRPLGADVDVVDGPVGSAMAHKLLRSVFMKGLAATIVEALEAGRAAGFEAWIEEQIVRELAGDGRSTVRRFESGSRLHGPRRASEMDAAGEYLASLGVPHVMASAAAEHLRQLTPRSGDFRPV